MKHVHILILALLVSCVAAAAVQDRVSCSNDALNVAFDLRDRTFSVTNRLAHRRWVQKPDSTPLQPISARQFPGGFDITFIDRPLNRPVQMRLLLSGNDPEFAIILTGSGPMPHQVMFPAPFLNEDDNDLILPLNEGVAINVEKIHNLKGEYSFQVGHGFCMAFFGATDGRDGCMAIVETPDDAAAEIGDTDGRAWVAPVWRSQMGNWGPPRKIRYVFTPDGGYVAMAKRYRQYAHTVGNVRTLGQKRSDRADIDHLVGAANVWFWGANAMQALEQMQQEGMTRILWSRFENEQQVRQMNDLGVLTGRYEIYGGVLDPSLIPLAVSPKPDWPTGAWPNGFLRDAHGKTRPSFSVRLNDGRNVDAMHVCDRVTVPLAQAKMAEELSHIPLRARFLDTTTALDLEECYDPRHPMNRGECRSARQELLGLVSGRFGLVAGSEDGADCYVPNCDYFEGMMSILKFRADVPDSTIGLAVDPPPDTIINQELNETIRIPLWELVYHDCAVSYWHWHDTNNKFPAVWHKRDLLNALYGTPPMYGIRSADWDKLKDRVIASYREAAAVARETGYSPMTDHRYLSKDRHVQQTRFANGIVVTANLGSKPFEMDDDYQLAPGSWRLERNKPQETGRQ